MIRLKAGRCFKSMRLFRTVVALIMAMSLGPLGAAGAAEGTLLAMGTGAVTGVYYPAGGAICFLLNKGRKSHGTRCVVEATEGSIANLEGLKAGEFDLALAQSDWVFYAYNGKAVRFEGDKAVTSARSVLSLHPESFTVVVRADSGITSFAELKGKSVDVGSERSGRRATADQVIAAYGWTLADFKLASELPDTDAGDALCGGQLDAVFYMLGHPNRALRRIKTKCDIAFVDVTGEPVEALIEEYPYLSVTAIPAGAYGGKDKATKTVGVRAVLVASSNVSSDAIYNLTTAVFDSFKTFQRLHPALSGLDMNEMATASLAAPLHDGAARYYAEKGLR